MPDPANTVLRVALPVPLARLFDYLPPPAMPENGHWIGRRVRVPFGKGELIGLVAAVGPPENPALTLKTVAESLDDAPLFSGELLDSLRWAARYYHAPLGETFATALPALLRAGQPLPETRAFAWRLTAEGSAAIARLRKNTATRRLAEKLQAHAVAEDRLDLEFLDWKAPARALAKRGLIERTAIVDPEVFAAETFSANPFPLNAEQAAVVEIVRAAIGRFQPLLLEGVTGSGKTEVYLQAIRECLARGRQALILVPEIGLTPQTLQRFRARLGVPVHALHSGLADGERSRAWTAMHRGEGRVLVGTRSAVFTPLPEAGLIIVDEEHDSSYKQQDGIRYHARDLAVVRAKALAVPVLLGSATPSLESLHNALAGRYAHLRLSQRAGVAKPPRVRVLDVRKRPLTHGLSKDVFDAIAACLQRDEQILVFKNRRGYAPVLLCHDCGWSAQCPRCDTPMTVHGGGRTLLCHHCGSRRSRPLSCPDCASLALQPQGFGTERLEEALAERFPDVPLIRVDSQSTRVKDGLEKKLAELGDTAGILVGTQMLTKGHDLPRLTLVCVVGIDEGLFSADFRAGEKLSQLLIQVAGRAGRAKLPGEVLLQTHHPEHPLLNTLLAGGYPAAAALELAQREAAQFPPYASMALLRAEAGNENDMKTFLREAREQFVANEAVVISAPMAAPMPRRAGKARGQLLLSSAQRGALQSALSDWLPRVGELKLARKVRWSLDVDPMDLY
jgi:primosomal protein N' (replication factor Y)